MKKAPKELWIRRGMLTGTLVAFLLPFLRVEDCQSHEVTTYIGFQLLLQTNGPWLLFSIVASALLLGLSFLRYQQNPLRRAFGACWRAVIAGVAGWWVGTMSLLIFMFDHITPHVGYFLCLASWAGVAVLCWVVGISAFIEHKREIEGEPPPDQISLLGVVFRVTAVTILATPFVALALLGEELLHVVAAVGALIFGSIPLAASLEFCAEATIREERWAMGWGSATTVIAWLAIALAFLA